MVRCDWSVGWRVAVAGKREEKGEEEISYLKILLVLITFSLL